jgi:hypothetical protein
MAELPTARDIDDRDTLIVPSITPDDVSSLDNTQLRHLFTLKYYLEY